MKLCTIAGKGDVYVSWSHTIWPLYIRPGETEWSTRPQGQTVCLLTLIGQPDDPVDMVYRGESTTAHVDQFCYEVGRLYSLHRAIPVDWSVAERRAIWKAYYGRKKHVKWVIVDGVVGRVGNADSTTIRLAPELQAMVERNFQQHLKMMAKGGADA